MTPLMKQYRDAKEQYPGMLLLFRMGDFYELFGADAKTTAKVLGLTLTARDEIPMAGFPHHQLEDYLRKLLQAGQRVAICDQVDSDGKTVKREVTRVITSDQEPKRCPTLPELTADKRKMAEFLGWSWGDAEKQACFSQLWQNYHDQLLASWVKSKNNPHKEQTYGQFLAECLREEFGLTQGTVRERQERLIAMKKVKPKRKGSGFLDKETVAPTAVYSAKE